MRILFLSALFSITALAGEEPNIPQHPEDGVEQPAILPESKDSEEVAEVDFNPFTGRVTSDKVRMRLQPNLESHIYSELNKGDLLSVCGASDDFYAVRPPKEVKGYVFRTYVLDGVIEGQNVNVRLEPALEAPVVAQLHTGDTVVGEPSKAYPKWIEIALPKNVWFYVAKEYVAHSGNSDLFYTMQDRFDRAIAQLTETEKNIEVELKKPFEEITIAPSATEFKRIMVENEDLPRISEKAHMLLQALEKTYLEKSIEMRKAREERDAQEALLGKDTLTTLAEAPVEVAAPPKEASQQRINNPYWEHQEQELIDAAIQEGIISSREDFYLNDRQPAITRTGVIHPYSRILPVKPGDFLLINPRTQLPIGFIYSTVVDLKQYMGKEVSLILSKRPDKNFAFPAFFVYAAEEIKENQ